MIEESKEKNMTSKEANRILSNGLVNAPSEDEWCMAFEAAIKAREQQKIIDALEVVNRSRRINNYNGTISCDRCRTWFYKNDRYSYIHYCPKCSEKMSKSEKK